jgi:hypothetical protein
VSNGEYRIGALGEFVSTPGTITNNEEVTVRTVSSIT